MEQRKDKSNVVKEIAEAAAITTGIAAVGISIFKVFLSNKNKPSTINNNTSSSNTSKSSNNTSESSNNTSRSNNNTSGSSNNGGNTDNKYTVKIVNKKITINPANTSARETEYGDMDFNVKVVQVKWDNGKILEFPYNTIPVYGKIAHFRYSLPGGSGQTSSVYPSFKNDKLYIVFVTSDNGKYYTELDGDKFHLVLPPKEIKQIYIGEKIGNTIINSPLISYSVNDDNMISSNYNTLTYYYFDKDPTKVDYNDYNDKYTQLANTLSGLLTNGNEIDLSNHIINVFMPDTIVIHGSNRNYPVSQPVHFKIFDRTMYANILGAEPYDSRLGKGLISIVKKYMDKYYSNTNDKDSEHLLYRAVYLLDLYYITIRTTGFVGYIFGNGDVYSLDDASNLCPKTYNVSTNVSGNRTGRTITGFGYYWATDDSYNKLKNAWIVDDLEGAILLSGFHILLPVKCNFGNNQDYSMSSGKINYELYIRWIYFNYPSYMKDMFGWYNDLLGMIYTNKEDLKSEYNIDDNGDFYITGVEKSISFSADPYSGDWCGYSVSLSPYHTDGDIVELENYFGAALKHITETDIFGNKKTAIFADGHICDYICDWWGLGLSLCSSKDGWVNHPIKIRLDTSKIEEVIGV